MTAFVAVTAALTWLALATATATRPYSAWFWAAIGWIIVGGGVLIITVSRTATRR